MSEDMFDTVKYDSDDLFSPKEVKAIVDKFGKASIFSYAVYSEMTDEDLFVLTKGLYVALACHGEIILGDDFEKNMIIIQAKEDVKTAAMFNRVENVNFNIVLGGCFKKYTDFIEKLLFEGLMYMQVECEFIGFFEVESNV
jgi:hypothetical protein|tara:strand:- start:2113 stop:2535 length:423 start_codon:yes stop_codon:yes gene_type:complete